MARGRGGILGGPYSSRHPTTWPQFYKGGPNLPLKWARAPF